ncbi:hypothetical protein GCM10022243_35450 [Saccharothrix violaceirubra]|uniref:histidine kinase n=1 Tax=Saccharothrix violaceirubra TaxID=413306 RepID=A0A7W7WUX8_9PSEU|nr:histidine kinase [Saccharothrix violaceirubra]MBB4963918.1 signal transduction histidine kinase [Saccharothrix violaceirubra]
MPTRSDAWLAAALVVLSAVASLLVDSGTAYRPPDALGFGFAVASATSLLWRQVAPLAVVAVADALVVASTASGYAVTVVQWPAWIALFTCFTVSTWWVRVTASVLTVAAVGGYAALDRGTVGPSELFSVVMVLLVSAAAGEAVRGRRAYAAAEQARAASESTMRERARLARELHDSLGHAVNVMVMQAGVGRRVFADNPEFAREALGNIENVGRDALGELDGLVRVLQDAPPPDFSVLVDRVRMTGRDLRVNTDEVTLSPDTGRALHRIAQEALTNALRHTSTGRIDIDLARVGDDVVLEVVNEGRNLTAGPGRGLANMRERAVLVGGTVEAGPVEGGFRVRATLPVSS